MLSGRRLDLLEPSPLDVEIEDITHGLARLARWNGQTSGDYPFSVAQHSLLVTDICATMRSNWPAKWFLAALLHDAAEYVIGDLISPFKVAVGLDYKHLEQRLQEAIHMRFGLPPALPQNVAETIKRADRASAYLEATQLAGFAPHEAARFFGKPRKTLDIPIKPLSTKVSERRFMRRFQNLAAEARLLDLKSQKG